MGLSPPNSQWQGGRFRNQEISPQPKTDSVMVILVVPRLAGATGGGAKPTHTPWKTKMTIGKIPVSNRKYTSSSCYFSMGYQVLVRQNSNPQTPHQESTSAHGVDSSQGNRRNGKILGSHFHLFCILF